MSINKQYEIVDKYNKTYHRTIKVKPADFQPGMYLDLEFNVGNHVRKSEYKNIFAKVYTPDYSEEVFVIKQIRNTDQWTYIINDLNSEEIV